MFLSYIGLWSVINNAGIAIGGPLDWQSLDDMKKLLWYFLHRLKDLHSNNNLRKFGIILMDVFFQFFEVIYHIFYISNFYIFSRTKEIETIENGKSCIYTLRLIGPILYPGECDVMAHP